MGVLCTCDKDGCIVLGIQQAHRERALQQPLQLGCITPHSQAIKLSCIVTSHVHAPAALCQTSVMSLLNTCCGHEALQS